MSMARRSLHRNERQHRRAVYVIAAMLELMKRSREESRIIGYCKYFVIYEWPWGRPVPPDKGHDREPLV